MSKATNTPAVSHESLLGRAADEFTARLHRGERPEIEEYTRRYPEIAAMIREVFPALKLMQAAGAVDADLASSEHDPSPAVGCIGDYRIIREIGRGGMGVVYEAEQISLRRRVALKVLPFAAVLDGRQLQRFKKEAQAAAHLHHTHIVPVFSVGCERGVHYYAMQYIEGHPLSTVVQELRQLAGLEPRDDASAAHAVPAVRTRRVSGGPDEDGGQDARPPGRAPRGNGGHDVPLAAQAVTAGLASGAWEPFKPSSGASSVLTLAGGGDGGAGRRMGRSTEDLTRSRALFRSIANLGVQAAEALQHAHSRDVIHRDVKPSNLLLDAQGNLWITDFGLALIQTDQSLTVPGDLLGTVRYMSPEQALAKRVLVDHRTDIYSLGVTLYELLTLEPVFSGSDRQELLRQIAFEDPRPPRKVRPGIPRELETIVLKAMAKRPDERYETAQDLADDLRRFLQDKPIRAQPPTVLDRVTKWSRRHRPVVVTAVLLLLVAVAGLSASTVLVARERAMAVRERDRAEIRRQEAVSERRRAERNLQLAREAVDRMLTRVADEELAEVPHMEQVRRVLLADALGFYQQFLEDMSTDADVHREAGRAHRRVGNINDLLGEPRKAQEAYTQAITLFGQLAGQDPESLAYREDLAETHEKLGLVLWKQGRPEEADAAYVAALSLWEELTAAAPESEDYQARKAGTLSTRGVMLHHLRRTAEAEAVYRRAIEIFEGLIARVPHDPDHLPSLARLYSNLGILLHEQSNRQKAEAAYRQAIVLQERYLASSAAKPVARAGLARYLSNLGLLLGDPARASEKQSLSPRVVELNEQLVMEWQRLVVDFPSVPEYRERLAETHRTLGSHFHGSTHFEAAEGAYLTALEVQRQLVEDFPAVAGYARDLVRLQMRLCRLLADAWQVAPAQNELQATINLAKQLAAVFPTDPVFREVADQAEHLLYDISNKTQAARLIKLAKESPEGVAESVHLAATADVEAMAPKPFDLLVYGEHLLIGGDSRRAAATIQRAVDHLTQDILFQQSYHKSLGWARRACGQEEAAAAFRAALGGWADLDWRTQPPANADPDHWTAAYFLDLIDEEQYADRWRDRVYYGNISCLPWFYIGQRKEIEGRRDEAIAAYRRSVELGQARKPNHTAHWAAYRLSILTEEPDPASVSPDEPTNPAGRD